MGKPAQNHGYRHVLKIDGKRWAAGAFRIVFQDMGFGLDNWRQPVKGISSQPVLRLNIPIFEHFSNYGVKIIKQSGFQRGPT